MNLTERILEDMKTAMRQRREVELSTLRLLRAAMKNKQIDLKHELSDEETVAVVKTQLKQLKDSMESFIAGSRQDLLDHAKEEEAVLSKYLPSQMSDADLEALVGKTLQEAGAASPADMGKAMGAAMKAVQGQADGARVKALVEKLLS